MPSEREAASAGVAIKKRVFIVFLLTPRAPNDAGSTCGVYH
jgi:hypothetical protein